jgi:hypothetical protein
MYKASNMWRHSIGSFYKSFTNGSITVVQKIESINTDSNLRLDRAKMENMHALQGWQQRHKDI